MGKDTVLRNQHIGVNKSQERDDDDPTLHDVWTLILTDKDNGDRIMLSFRSEVRDQIVSLLGDSGIVLAKHL